MGRMDAPRGAPPKRKGKPMNGSEPTMPFGRYRGRPLVDLPTDYLRWLVRECRGLSAGLRRQATDLLEGRGYPAPAAPARPAAPDRCPHCGGAAIGYGWMEDCRGRRCIRRTCRRCQAGLGFAPLVGPYTTWADQAASATSILDVLTLCEEQGLRLQSDGQVADFAGAEDWWRAPT